MAPPNILPIHGNEKTMNMNPMILTNIQSSPYFKVRLYELKTYHEVVDEIYYKVQHLEPWEKGSRKTAGQTGMCGGVRGVGAGGIVSSAYCLLYKLFTLRLTRKQLVGLLQHADSCYIRALGFMYIRYTQPPADFWEWFKPYLDDQEEIDVKAGGGHLMNIGEMLRTWLTKLEWYSTLFPRIPVPIQKAIETNLREWEDERRAVALETAQARRAMAGGGANDEKQNDGGGGGENAFGEAERHAKLRESPVRNYGGRRPTPPFDIAGEMEKDRKHSSHRSSRHKSKSREREKKRSRSRDRDRKRSRSHERERRRSRDRDRGDRDRARRSRSRDRRRSRSRDRHDRDRDRERRRSRSKERRRSRSRDRHEHRRSRSRERHRHRSRSHERRRERDHRESSFERDLRREKERHRHRDRDKHRDSD